MLYEGTLRSSGMARNGMVLLMHCLMALVMGLLIDEAQVKAVILNDAAAEEAAADAHHELAMLHTRAFREIIPIARCCPCTASWLLSGAFC